MNIGYSASERGFFPLADKAKYEAAGGWPSDIVEITDEYRAELLAGELVGKKIAANDNGYPILKDAPRPTEEEARKAWQRERAALVAAIRVTTSSGRILDGDEISQGRMARAILGLQGQPEGATVQWVLSDNTAVDIGLAELQEALTLAGLRQTELWVQA